MPALSLHDSDSIAADCDSEDRGRTKERSAKHSKRTSRSDGKKDEDLCHLCEEPTRLTRSLMGCWFDAECFPHVRAFRRALSTMGTDKCAEADRQMLDDPGAWRDDVEPFRLKAGGRRRLEAAKALRYKVKEYKKHEEVVSTQILNRTRFHSFHQWWDKWSPSQCSHEFDALLKAQHGQHSVKGEERVADHGVNSVESRAGTQLYTPKPTTPDEGESEDDPDVVPQSSSMLGNMHRTRVTLQCRSPSPKRSRREHARCHSPSPQVQRVAKRSPSASSRASCQTAGKGARKESCSGSARGSADFDGGADGVTSKIQDGKMTPLQFVKEKVELKDKLDKVLLTLTSNRKAPIAVMQGCHARLTPEQMTHLAGDTEVLVELMTGHEKVLRTLDYTQGVCQNCCF